VLLRGGGQVVVLVGAIIVISDGFDVSVVRVDPVVVVLFTGALMWPLRSFTGRSGCRHGIPDVVGSASCVAATAAVRWVILPG